MSDLRSTANTDVRSVSTWSNYSGTLAQSIPTYCTPLGIDGVADQPGGLGRHGASIREILTYAFDQGRRVRTLGSTWSFSKVLEPGPVAINPSCMAALLWVPPSTMAQAYQPRVAAGFAPVYVEAGATIGSLNARLAKVGLALQTSGAGDGQMVAGCIATGTHGSALQIGAVHDTVRAVHVVISPDRALFIQSRCSPVCDGPAAAAWLSGLTGILTVDKTDDDAFSTVAVSLGSMGVVFGVVLEAAPLYRLRRHVVCRRFDDAELWAAIANPTSASFGCGDDLPYHFDVTFHPYPAVGAPNAAYATVMWATSAGDAQPDGPDPVVPDASTDKMTLIANLAQDFDGQALSGLAVDVIRAQIDSELASTYTVGDDVAFAGEIFGPTSLPQGTGASTEMVVPVSFAVQALRIVYEVLARQGASGRHLLGVVGVRFVPATTAFLGMNVAPMSCFIELPSIRTQDVLALYAACWQALEQAGIPFTCHWGQLHALTPARVQAYFGDRAARWTATRKALLGADAEVLFASSMLDDVGLR